MYYNKGNTIILYSIDEHGLLPQVHGARGEGAARLQALQGTGAHWYSYTIVVYSVVP
jgi:hypothetical protein